MKIKNDKKFSNLIIIRKDYILAIFLNLNLKLIKNCKISPQL